MKTNNNNKEIENYLCIEKTFNEHIQLNSTDYYIKDRCYLNLSTYQYSVYEMRVHMIQMQLDMIQMSRFDLLDIEHIFQLKNICVLVICLMKMIINY